MAKKSMKEAANMSASALDTLISGDIQPVENSEAVQDTQKPEKRPQSRLNLKIDTELKEYLQAAAYRESSPQKTVSLTEYLCGLIREDMQKHNGEA